MENHDASRFFLGFCYDANAEGHHDLLICRGSDQHCVTCVEETVCRGHSCRDLPAGCDRDPSWDCAVVGEVIGHGCKVDKIHLHRTF